MLGTTHAHVDVVSTGVVGQVVNVTFQSYDSDSWQVVSIDGGGTETPLAAGVNYDITEPVAPLPNTGAIEMLIAPAAGDTIRVRRVVDLEQVIDLVNQGAYTPDSLEKGLDLIVMMIQQTAEGTLPVGSFLHGNLANAAIGVYHALATTVLPGFYSAADKVANDGHRAAAGVNAHAETPASIGAAPSSHVGSRDLVLGHPAATLTQDGMMLSTDKQLLADLAVNDFRANFIDDFDGGGLDAGKWSRSTSGTPPTASMQTNEYGVYRELTAAAASGAIIYSNRGPAAKRNPTWRSRLAIGVVGSVISSVAFRFGLSATPTTAHGADTDFAYFWWDGTTMWARSKGVGAEGASSFATPDFAFHEYQIDLSTAQAVFKVDGSVVATHTTNLPTAATALSRFFDILNTGVLARSIDVDYVQLYFTREYT